MKFRTCESCATLQPFRYRWTAAPAKVSAVCVTCRAVEVVWQQPELELGDVEADT